MTERAIPLKQFLESAAPLATHLCELGIRTGSSGAKSLIWPPITSYCPSSTCSGDMIFETLYDTQLITADNAKYGLRTFVDYRCKHCGANQSARLYALKVSFPEGTIGRHAVIQKIGERPRLGTPNRDSIADLLEDQASYFDKGYHSETAGLGIGAFAYYRRYVESHKNEIIEAIKKVALTQGAGASVIAGLDRALKTPKFDSAINEIKDGIPESMKLRGGHNPLTLLHRALSGGLHNDNDDECLALAEDIRVVLGELAEKVKQALKDNAELDRSVARLLNKTNPANRQEGSIGST